MTTDTIILGAIEGFKIPFTSTPMQKHLPTKVSFSDEEKIHVEHEISRLLKTGVLVTCNREPGDFISNIFLREKKNGSFRMILNLKQLNEYIPYQHFKMENLQQAVNMMTDNCYMCTIDLLEAYYCVSIHTDYQKYLKFCYEGKHYKYTVFPNGLSCCPRIFTKLMKPVLAKLRQKGHESVQYIDDGFLKGFTYKECQQNLMDTVQLLQDMGFIIHPEKSVLTPVQEITFLGFVLNSSTMTVSLTEEKKAKIKSSCSRLIACTRPKIRHVAEVIGLLVSALPGVHCGRLFIHSLHWDKNKGLKQCKGNYAACMQFSPESIQELHWWQTTGITTSYKISHSAPAVVAMTDASKKGWGGVIQGTCETVNGPWSEDEKRAHINCLELKAILFTLKSLCQERKDIHIPVLTDNTCAVSYITNFGGCRSLSCHNIARDIP